MDIKSYLQNLGISFKTYSHPAVFTCEEAEKYNKDMKSIHSKNLFLKDEKSKGYYLAIIPANEKLDFKKIDNILNKKIKFANQEELKEILNLTIGSVSPFGLINDKKHIVEILINKKILESEFVSFHPNMNTETIEISKNDFLRFLSSLKVDYTSF
jgi:Ala-tRNA(Pro) deacylase